MSGMDPSPKGHDIEKITGDADAIGRRGHDIRTLGDQMQMAANTLQLLADEKIGKGLSIDDLRDQSDDAHGDLKKAGERYSPSGDILVAYATALRTAQSALDAVVDDCVELWSAVEAKNGALDSAEETQRTQPPAPDSGSGTDEDPVGDAREAANRALADFQERAADYDVPYENWDKAYDDAVHRLQHVNDSGVHDSFWDDIAPALEFILKVLEVAGLVLLVAALIIGGPILAALATIVAIATLVVTALLMPSGRQGWGDLAWAVVGVLPFGKLGKFAHLGSEAASSTARFPKLATFGKLFVGADDFAKTGQHFANISNEARTAWNAGGNLVPYAHLSVLSTMGLEGRQALRYLGRQSIQWGTSRSIVLGRLTGLDNPATASVIDRIGAYGEGYLKNTLGSLVTIKGWID